MSHYHSCPECGSDWECFDLDCASAVHMYCDLCAEEEEELKINDSY